MSTEALQDQFARSAKDHTRHTLEGNAKETNSAYESLVEAVRKLRSTENGGVEFFRKASTSEDLGIAAWAALYLLRDDEQHAIAALERVASAGVPRLSFGARMTLKEWRAGRLTVD